ncbi:hypothetical protein EIP86_004701 [Pleurotus ostreatoroseus]|nr:hypothetical protein EIP86_004701 [Pleurotus ostreatoroseus]
MLARRSLLPKTPSPLSSTACSTPISIQARTIVSLKPSVVFPHRNKARVYDERKTYLYNQYTRLFKDSEHVPSLFFSYADFSVKRILKLRLDINAAAVRHATKPPPSLSALDPAPEAPIPMPKFTVLRGAIFGIALRDFTDIDRDTAQAMVDMVNGNLAVLTMPNLNPPQMNAVLRAIARSVPPRIPKTPEQIEAERKEEEKAFVPGRRPKRHRPEPVPEMKLLGALIESRLFKAEGVEDVAKLPTLDVLRAQLVGLLSSPSAQLAAVLSQASGGKLARTLEGLKKSLEEGQSTPPDAP